MKRLSTLSVAILIVVVAGCSPFGALRETVGIDYDTVSGRFPSEIGFPGGSTLLIPNALMSDGREGLFASRQAIETRGCQIRAGKAGPEASYNRARLEHNAAVALVSNMVRDEARPSDGGTATLSLEQASGALQRSNRAVSTLNSELTVTGDSKGVLAVLTGMAITAAKPYAAALVKDFGWSKITAASANAMKDFASVPRLQDIQCDGPIRRSSYSRMAAETAAPTGKAAPAPFDAPASKGEAANGPVAGSLEPGDDEDSDGRYFDSYKFAGSPGMELTINLTSTAFDTYLRVNAPDGSSWSDDDSGEDSNSRLVIVMGGYELFIEVTSYDAAESGAYEMILTRAAYDVINTNETVEGRLSGLDNTLESGSYYDSWTYSGTAGETITIDLKSDEFDPIVSVLDGPVGVGNVLGGDDDGGDDTNSRLELTLGATEAITIVATAYLADDSILATGTYTLSVAGNEGAPPPITSGGDSNGKYALLVGIGDYPGTNMDLQSSARDVTAVYDLVTGPLGFPASNVLMLRDAEATRDNIMEAFRTHLGQAGPDGVALFYYTGHGTQPGENLGLQAPLDPEPDGTDEALAVWASEGMNTMILDDELGFMADQLLSERAVMIIDACFSGTGTKDGDSVAKIADWKSFEERLSVPTDYDLDPGLESIIKADSLWVFDDMRLASNQILPPSKGQLSFDVVLWPNGVVPYVFDDSLSTAAQLMFIEASLEWAGAAPVRFIPRNDESEYIFVLHTDDPNVGGSATLGLTSFDSGFVGGALWIPQVPDRTSMIHEMGHVLGLTHEQNRSDRDRHVDIILANVKPDYEHNFRLQSGQPCTEYDFDSIMHYPSQAFSVNGQPTIVPKPALRQGLIQWNAEMSPGDAETMTELYRGNCADSADRVALVALEGQPTQHVLLSASDYQSSAWTSSNLPGVNGSMSVFTYYLIDVLSSSSQSATLEEIGTLINARVDAFNVDNSIPVQGPGVEGVRKVETMGYMLGLDR